MGKTATNLSIVIGLITVAFAGYYLYTQKSASMFLISSNDQTIEDMLNSTAEFIEYRQILDRVSLDTNLFEDKRFTSLRSFSTPIEEQPVGRPNPFLELEEAGDSQ